MKIKPRILNLVLIFVFVISSLGITSKNVTAQMRDLFFSEYVEGGVNNKALEIYNSTGIAIDLAAGDYEVRMYFNASPDPTTTIDLSGTIANGDVFVVADDNAVAAVLAVADQTSTYSFFNGDDAIALVKGGTVIDVIGQIGFDPGSQWGSDLTSTENNTLRRKVDICQGDPDGSDVFDPAIEWDGYTQDTFDGLGSHTANCSIPDDVISVVYTNPADAAINVSLNANIEIVFSEPVTLDPGWYDITCSGSGVHSAVVTDNDPLFILDPNDDFSTGETCAVTVYAEGVTADSTEEPIPVMTEDYTFSFTTVSTCGDTFTPIYTIQGSGESSPDVGLTRETEGVVVADFQDGMNGFYIQDLTGDDVLNTSDGVFVYAPGGMDVNVGDHLRIMGVVSEYKKMTEITASEILLCKSDQDFPAPTVLNLPVDDLLDFERLEGMLVAIPQSLVIAEYFNYDRYGEIMLSTERFMTFTAENEPSVPGFAASELEYVINSITMDDARTEENPDPAVHPNGWEFTMSNLFRGGDLVANVSGVIDQFVDYYGNSYYRIQPVQEADYTPVNERPATYELIEGDIKIASFNVLNYFTTIDDGINDICGPSGLMECRGADTAEELARQRAKILAALVEIDADVFGLMEIENDRKDAPTPDYAVADLVAGLNSIVGAGVYDYIPTGAVGTDAIKQAIIYKPAKVTQIGTFQALTSAYDPDFVDTKNRPTLAQVFEDQLTGEDFIVAVNHLKSKGSACAGDPDLGDGAGNCNLTRLAAAEVMVDWLADPAIFPDVDNVLIIGDLNSYDKEDPIDAIKLGSDDLAGTGDDFVDLIHQILGDEAYGYVFDGHTGYLDYALTNTKMANAVVDVDIWHINADEPSLIDYDMSFKKDAQDDLYAPDAYRSSDHDPVIITLSFRPYSKDDHYGVLVDSVLNVSAEEGVLANDSDPYDIGLIAVLVDDVDTGMLDLEVDGSFVYTPAAGFNGDATFTYRVSNGLFESDIATVKIKVTNPPNAVDNSYSTDEDITLSISAPGVLENDTDIDGDSITAVLVSDVSSGTLTLLPDGSFTYTPDLNYNGSDRFTYKAYDCGLYSETAEVAITINPVNDPPVAIDDFYETDEDIPLAVSAPGIFFNDSDPEGDSLTAYLETDVSNGTLNLVSDGSFTYTPDPNYNGTDSFSYKAFDGHLYSDPVEVTIRINLVDEYIFLPIILN